MKMKNSSSSTKLVHKEKVDINKVKLIISLIIS